MSWNVRVFVLAIVAILAVGSTAEPATAGPGASLKYTCDYYGAGPAPAGAPLPPGTGLVSVVCTDKDDNVYLPSLPGLPAGIQPVVFPLPNGQLMFGSLEEGSARDTTVYRDNSFSSTLEASGFSGWINGEGPYDRVDIQVRVDFGAGSVSAASFPFPDPTLAAGQLPSEVRIQVLGKTPHEKQFSFR